MGFSVERKNKKGDGHIKYPLKPQQNDLVYRRRRGANYDNERTQNQ